MAETPAAAPAQQEPAPVAGLSFEHLITPVSEAAAPNSMAVMGRYKAGKTTLAASVCRVPSLIRSGKEVLILEAEKGTASIAKDYPEVKQFSLSHPLALDRAVDELITRPHNFGVVIIDTYDKFQALREKYELGLTPNDTRSAYGRLKTWTVDMAWKLHNAPFLVIFLFHEDDVKDERTGAITTTYSLVGGAKKDLGQVFDLIGRLTVVENAEGENERVLQLAQTQGVVTGSRWEQELPPTMVQPTMAKIFDIIEGKKADDTAALTKE